MSSGIWTGTGSRQSINYKNWQNMNRWNFFTKCKEKGQLTSVELSTDSNSLLFHLF